MKMPMHLSLAKKLCLVTSTSWISAGSRTRWYSERPDFGRTTSSESLRASVRTLRGSPLRSLLVEGACRSSSPPLRRLASRGVAEARSLRRAELSVSFGGACALPYTRCGVLGERALGRAPGSAGGDPPRNPAQHRQVVPEVGGEGDEVQGDDREVLETAR